MSDAPGFVMTIPGSGREVRVRADDLSEWEQKGYVLAGRPPAEPPQEAGAASTPAATAPAPDDSATEEATNRQEPKPAVQYPRTRGRNSAPRG